MQRVLRALKSATSGAKSPPLKQTLKENGKQSSSRLPLTVCAPSDEFKSKLSWFERTKFSLERMTGIGVGHVFHNHMTKIFIASVASVFGLGCTHAAMLLESVSLDHMAFIAEFGLQSVIPSCVFMEVDPLEVLRSLEVVNPEGLLRPVDNTTAEGARRALQLQTVVASRYAVASLLVLAQFVGAINVLSGLGKVYMERIYAGKEPFMPGVRERILRLCGSSSDVTSLSLIRYGMHIAPVFENPARLRHLVDTSLERSGIDAPVFFQVDKALYGMAAGWKRLHFDHHGFLCTTTGRRFLYIEADGTNSEEALGLRNVSKDLKFDEAAMACRQIERRVRQILKADHSRSMAVLMHGQQQLRKREAFRPFRVYLGDSMQAVSTGGGRRMTVRERNKRTKEMDVVVDSRAPILLGILRWLERLSHVLHERAEEEKRKQQERAEKERKKAEDEKTAEKKEKEKEKEKAYDRYPDKGGEAGRVEGEEEDENNSRSDEGGTAWFGRSAELADTQLTVGQSGRSDSKQEADPEPSSRGKSHGDTDNADGSKAANNRRTFASRLFRITRQHTRPPLCVDVGNPEYFKSLKLLLEEFGFEVMDAADVPDDETKEVPRLIYHSTTATTVNTVLTMLRGGVIDPELCCVVIEKAEGIDELLEVLGDHTLLGGQRIADSSYTPIVPLVELTRATNTALASRTPERRSRRGSDRNGPGGAAPVENLARRLGQAHTSMENEDRNERGKNERLASKQQHIGANTQGSALASPRHLLESRQRKDPGPRAGAGVQKGCELICASVMYDDILRQIRVWVRAGFSAEDIQAELDLRFGDVLEHQQAVKEDYDAQRAASDSMPVAEDNPGLL